MKQFIKGFYRAVGLCMAIGLMFISGVRAADATVVAAQAPTTVTQPSAGIQPAVASLTTPAADQAKVAEIQTAQSDVARIEAEIAKATQNAEVLKNQAEEAMKKVLTLEQTGKIASPEYAPASAEASRLRAEYEDARLKITKLVGEKASAQAQANGVRLDLIQQMKDRIAAKVQEFKAEAATHLAKAEMAPVTQLATDVAKTIPADKALSTPVAVPSFELSPETLKLQAAAKQAQADSAAAAQRAQAAEEQMKQLTAAYEKTKQDIAAAQAKEAEVAQKAAQLQATVDAAQAAAKQAEIKAAVVTPPAPTIVTAVNLPEGFELDDDGFAEVSVGANNGALEIWGVDKSGMLHRWNAQAPAGSRMEVFNAIDNSRQALTGFSSVSIAADGTLFALRGGKAYRFDWSNNQFFPESAGAVQTDLSLDRVAVGSNVNIWAVDSKSQRIYQLTQSGWMPRFDGKAVSAAADNTVLALNSQGVAYRRVQRKTPAAVAKRKKAKKKVARKAAGRKAAGKKAGVAQKSGGQSVSWQVVDPKNRQKLNDIAVVNKDLAVGIAQGTGELVQLVGKREQWVAAQGLDGKPATGFSRIAANAASTMVALDINGRLVRRGTQAVAPQAAAVAKQKTVAKARPGKQARKVKGKAAKKGKVAAKRKGARKGAAAGKGKAGKGAARRGAVKKSGAKKASAQRGRAKAGARAKSAKGAARKAGSSKKSVKKSAKKSKKKSAKKKVQRK